jgi:hypothetical protein
MAKVPYWQGQQPLDYKNCVSSDWPPELKKKVLDYQKATFKKIIKVLILMVKTPLRINA